MRATQMSATVSALALLLAAPSALAAELTFDSRIDSVTVFPDAAMVTRIGALAIPSGSHTLVLQGLPAEVDPASIRIEGSANAALMIGSVETRAAPADPKAESEGQKKLRDLRAALAEAQGQIEAAETQKRAIEKSAAGPSDREKPMEVAQLRSLWSAVGEATAEVNGKLVGLRQRSADIEADIRALEAVLVRGRPGMAPRTDLTVAIETERDTRADLKITYRVRNARWLPTYDARLDTGTAQVKPKLELIRRASIVQRTGEDWADAEVTLSTTRVAGNAAAPPIDTLAVTIWEPPVVAMDMARRSAQAPMAAAPAPAAKANMQEADAARMVIAQERGAAMLSTDFSAEYKVPGRITVSRDGAQKTVRLSARDYAPELVARAVPALETRAYLSARLVNADEAPLLAGEVNVFRDGIFVGKTRMVQTAPGDSLDFGFGSDEKIKVERVPMKKRENDPSWPTSSKFQISDYRTTITNLHARPMKVSVIDRVPVSENTAITVETLRETTPPTEKQVADKRGVMGWTWDMAPGEKKEVRVAWRMRWPADARISLNGQVQ